MKIVAYYVPSYDIAGDYFQALCNIIVPALPSYGCKDPWLLHRIESIVPSRISLENHNFSFSVGLSKRYSSQVFK